MPFAFQGDAGRMVHHQLCFCFFISPSAAILGIVLINLFVLFLFETNSFLLD